MGEGNIPFKTNLDQKIGPFRKRKTTPKPGLAGPIRATEVDAAKEKNDRIRWVVKWILLLPLSIYMLLWLLLILFDFFSY